MRAAEWYEVVFTDESRICLQHQDGRIRVWRHRGERMLHSCVMHRHTGPAPCIMVCGGIGYHSRTPLVRISGTLNSQRYISEVLEPVALPYFQGLATAIFQQDNALPHVASNVQRRYAHKCGKDPLLLSCPSQWEGMKVARAGDRLDFFMIDGDTPISTSTIKGWNWRGRKYIQPSAPVGSAAITNKTFEPTDLTRTYSVCTRRVFGGIGHRAQAFRSGFRCSNH
ncbi:transposable element Tcb1 transposase [Trichonephila clavipes]|uniref:Transposable element Tcb1 transposase n=1 Tax=Trichonephila clavipes TaxID=2585209 RepID=A0A8X6VFC0_TRICX|nr:transposable element Tcb1 transposase [Trichonephila clavipes]